MTMKLGKLLKLYFLALLPAVLTLSSALQADHNWPSFRGADSRGVSKEKNLPSEWDTKKNVVWSIPIPGRSWSSPIVWGDKLFILSAVNEGKDHDPKKGLYYGGDRKDPLPFVHHWTVFCINTKTGKTIWEKKAKSSKPDEPIHIKNTYASETPVTDGERVYAYFGNVGVYAYDLNGEKIWEKAIEANPYRYGWGSAASPILVGDSLIIVNDNQKQSYLLALNKKTGDELWRKNREEGSNWATPYLWKNKLRSEIITPGTGRVRSYDLKGNLLWDYKGMSSITIATPYSVGDLLIVSSGYILDRHRPIYGIKPGAKGDISLKKGETKNDFIAWYQPLAAPYNPSTLTYGEYLYVLLDRGFMACYKAKTGEVVYSKKRLGRGMSFTSSPWAYDGKIFCLNEDGNTVVVQAGPEFKILANNDLEEMCMATPAVANGAVYVRSLTKLYKIAKN